MSGKKTKVLGFASFVGEKAVIARKMIHPEVTLGAQTNALIIFNEYLSSLKCCKKIIVTRELAVKAILTKESTEVQRALFTYFQNKMPKFETLKFSPSNLRKLIRDMPVDTNEFRPNISGMKKVVVRVNPQKIAVIKRPVRSEKTCTIHPHRFSVSEKLLEKLPLPKDAYVCLGCCNRLAQAIEDEFISLQETPPEKIMHFLEQKAIRGNEIMPNLLTQPT